MNVTEWMVVEDGGVAGLEEAEDKKSEAKVWREVSERWAQELKGVNYTESEEGKKLWQRID